jgi:hypothetical protein
MLLPVADLEQPRGRAGVHGVSVGAQRSDRTVT